MSLELSKDTKEGIVILSLKGRLIVGEPVAKLRENVNQLLAEGLSKIVLNLKDVDYIDSTGLGGMVICLTTLQKAGGGLKLVNVNRRNMELLELTNLTKVFGIFEDEQNAINSFFPGREIKKFDVLSFVKEETE